MAVTINTDEAAMRWAKTIMQDIFLYNSEKIKQGLVNDTIFDVMADEFNEGRNLYKSRVAPEILSRTNFFDRAINDHLIKVAVLNSKGALTSKID